MSWMRSIRETQSETKCERRNAKNANKNVYLHEFEHNSSFIDNNVCIFSLSFSRFCCFCFCCCRCSGGGGNISLWQEQAEWFAMRASVEFFSLNFGFLFLCNICFYDAHFVSLKLLTAACMYSVRVCLSLRWASLRECAHEFPQINTHIYRFSIISKYHFG